MMLVEARAPLVPLAALAHCLFDGLVNMTHVLLQLGPRLERLGALRAQQHGAGAQEGGVNLRRHAHL